MRATVMGKQKQATIYEIYSEILKQKVWITYRGGGVAEMKTADGVQYSASEMFLLFREGVEYDPRVHLMKKIFGGDIAGINSKDRVIVGEKNRLLEF